MTAFSMVLPVNQWKGDLLWSGQARLISVSDFRSTIWIDSVTVVMRQPWEFGSITRGGAVLAEQTWLSGINITTSEKHSPL